MVRGSWRPKRTAIFWPPFLWPSTLYLSRSPWLLNRRPRGPLCWLSLPHLISNFPPTVPNCLTSVLTELYNSSTSTQSPTRSLEWQVWSSSSGNNCHAVQRSLSSGASVYESIMGFFTLSHFISQARPRDLFRLLAIGMCHFFPVHHFIMACLSKCNTPSQNPEWLALWTSTPTEKTLSTASTIHSGQRTTEHTVKPAP